VVQAKHRTMHIGHLRACAAPQAAGTQRDLEFVSHDARYPPFAVDGDQCSGEVLEHLDGAGAHMLLSGLVSCAPRSRPRSSAAPVLQAFCVGWAWGRERLMGVASDACCV
jgi:hypothetical protein